MGGVNLIHPVKGLFPDFLCKTSEFDKVKIFHVLMRLATAKQIFTYSNCTIQQLKVVKYVQRR